MDYSRTGSLLGPSLGLDLRDGVDLVWDLSKSQPDNSFRDFRVPLQQKRRDLFGGSDATTMTCKRGLKGLTLWLVDLKGRKETERNTHKQNNCFIGGQGLNVRWRQFRA